MPRINGIVAPILPPSRAGGGRGLEPPPEVAPIDWKGKGPLPTKVVSRSVLLKRIWEVVQFILPVILQMVLWLLGLPLVGLAVGATIGAIELISSRLSKKFELSLYEDIVLSSSKRHLLGSSSSALLQYLYDFFKQDKETPPVLLNQLKQAVRWSEKLDAAEDSSHDKRQSRLIALSNEIVQSIQKMKDGDAILVPGGLHLPSDQQFAPQQFAMYRVTKKGEEFCLELHSRDGLLAGTKFKTVQGKEKISTTVYFDKIKQDKIADAALWHALFAAHLPKASDDVEKTEASPGFLHNLILRFLGRPGKVLKQALTPGAKTLEESPLPKLLDSLKENLVEPSGYHAARSLNRVQNVWDLATDPQGGMARSEQRKLRLHLETLFKYFEMIKDDLDSAPLHRFYLKEGVEALSQTVDEMYRGRKLSEGDWMAISAEFKAISDCLKRSEKREEKLSWRSGSSKLELRKGCVEKMGSDVSYRGVIPLLYDKTAPIEIPSARDAFQPSKIAREIELPPRLKGKTPIRPDTVLADLDSLIAHGQRMVDHPIELQHEILDAVWSLPKWLHGHPTREELRAAEARIDELFNRWSTEIEANPWKKLSPEDRLKALEKLTEISRILVESAKVANTALPDRAIALIRIGNLSSYLCRLDEKKSGLTAAYEISHFHLLAIKERSFRNRSGEHDWVNEEDQNQSMHWEHARNKAWRALNPGKYSKQFNSQGEGSPETRHKGLLLQQIASLHNLVNSPVEDRDLCVPSEQIRSKLSSWGLPIDHPLMKAAALRFGIGAYQTNKDSYNRDATTTQEEVMDHPERALKRVYNDLFSDILSKQETARLRNQRPSRLNISFEEFQLFLLALQDKMAIWNILGIVEKCPDLLSQPECRAAFEIYLIDRSRIESTLRRDSELAPFLKQFFSTQIERAWNRGDTGSALFLIRIAHNLKIQKFVDFDFREFLRIKFETHPDPSTKHSLATELLWLLQYQEKLTLTEARKYLVYGFFFEHMQPDPESFDPAIDDEVRIALRRRTPLLMQELGDDVQAALDEICSIEGIPLPAEQWNGGYPQFMAGKVEIDLYHGMINDDRSGMSLPSFVIQSPQFRLFFPVGKGQLRAQPIPFHGGIAYAFVDGKGRPWRVEVRDEKIILYKKQGDLWLQFLSPKDYPADLKTPLPAYVLGQRIFAASPSDLWVFDKEENPLFRIALKKNGNIEKADDLRVGGQLGRQLAPLSFLDPVQLHPFLAFEDGKQILVWSNKGKIEEIEMPRHRLRFRVEKDGSLLCTASPFEGYRVLYDKDQLPGVKGLPASIALAPPNEKQPIRLIVPHFNGSYVDNLPSPMIGFKLSKGIIAKTTLSRFLPANIHVPKFSWQVTDTTGYWTYAVPMGDPVFGSPQGAGPMSSDPAALLDLLEYALHQTAVEKGAAVALAERILEQFQLLTSVPEELAQRARRIGEFAARGDRKIVTDSLPETSSLGLRILLALRAKAPAHTAPSIDKAIGMAAVAYFQHGKHVNWNSLLTREQEKEVAQIIRKPSETSDPQKRREFFPVQEGRNYDIARMFKDLNEALRKKESIPSGALFSQDPGKLLRAFPQVYTALKSPVDSLDFKRMRLTLKLTPSTDFTSYMEFLFDLKAKLPQLNLPDLPDLSHFKKSSRDFNKHSDYRAHVASTTQTLADFIGKFPAPPEVAQPLAPAAQQQIDPPKIVESQWNLLEVQLAEGVEKRKLSLRLPKQASSLIERKDLDGVFSENLAPKIQWPDLSRTKADAEPAVQKEAVKLKTQLEKYRPTHIVSIGQPQRLKELIQEKEAFWKGEADHWRKEVEDFLKDSDSQFQTVEVLGGRQLSVTWNDLKTAFLQGSLPSVTRKLKGVSEEVLKEKLTRYYEAESFLKHAAFTLNEFKTAEQEGLLDSPATAEKILQLFIRKRGYDIQEHPELLVMEETLGYLMEEAQFEMVRQVLSDSHSVCQAVTGAGKTSVIMPLLGLMKANGTNLVTLKFLDSLFAENASNLQKTLGQAMKKKVMTLLFSAKTPIAVRRADGNQESVFKKMYEDLLRTIQEKGCLLTNRRSQPLLEGKFIALLYRAANSELSSIDREHLFFLAKILRLLKERQECIFDEHDKSLHPRDEIHLALGKTGEPPLFAIEIIKEVFDIAILEKGLGLKQNIQAELSDKDRDVVRAEIARKIAQKWQSRELNAEACLDYFLGKDDRVVKQALSPETLDRLSLTKDLFLTYLPNTLAQTAGQKYILSEEDGESVIPCEYTDIPREGSQFDNPIERLIYSTQYHHQKGISTAFLRRWHAKLLKSALAEMELQKLESLSDTSMNRTFRTYFPHRVLPRQATDSEVEQWQKEILEKPELVSKFLEEILPHLAIQKAKVSIDAQNQVSLSRASAGISATEGCEKGLHPQFHLSQKKGDDTARMVRSLLEKVGVEQPLLKYSAKAPGQILDQLLAQQPKMGVVIDGAGALLGVRPQDAAQKLTGQLKAVSYYDRAGRSQTIGNGEAPLKERGQVYPHHAARGADAKLSPSVPAVVLVNGRDPFEVFLQNAGRVRHPNHQLQVAVPEESQINGLGEVINRTIAVQANENSDNLYRSELQKIRDAVRSSMLDELYVVCSEGQVEHGVQQFRKFQNEGNYLVTEQVENWSEAGGYFAAHGKIQHKRAKPIEILNQRREEAAAIIKRLSLKSRLPEPQDLAADMPSGVWNNTHLALGQQAQVEVEVQLSVQQESQVEVQTVVDQEEESPIYLKWIQHDDAGHFKIHRMADLGLIPAKIYDPVLAFTENFLPLRRKEWADKIHHRVPHERKQNRLHYVAFGHLPFGGPEQVTVLDDLDARGFMWDNESLRSLDERMRNLGRGHGGYNGNYEIYDVHLKRFISKRKEGERYDLQTTKRVFDRPIKLPDGDRFTRLIVQVKFEDGQISGYSKEEEKALERWLMDHQEIIQEVESYLVKEVLRNRPHEKAAFPASQLGQIFEKVKGMLPADLLPHTDADIEYRKRGGILIQVLT